MIPAETVDLVLQTAVIEDVIGDYVELKKSGSSLRGLSPFTNEKTPSFYVLPEKGIFKCFSSDKGGSVVTFLMELEKLSFPEAIKQLASRYGIEIQEEEVSPEQQQAAQSRARRSGFGEYQTQCPSRKTLHLEDSIRRPPAHPRRVQPDHAALRGVVQ